MLLMNAYKQINDTSSDQRDKFLQDKVWRNLFSPAGRPTLRTLKYSYSRQLRLFADYFDCWGKGQLQKLHYLSEYLILR